MRKSHFLVASALTAALTGLSAATPAEAQGRTQVGTLACHVSPGVGFVVGSSKTLDCVFSYAFFLASGRQHSYPPFGELHALHEATPADIVDGLQAATTMLSAVIATADPETRAVIGLWPYAETGAPRDFAARGALEMILHAHDVCAGLGVPFDPPQVLCRRLRERTREWPGQALLPPTDDAWRDLLQRSGRPPASAVPATPT